MFRLSISVITIYTARRLSTCSFSSPPPSSSEVTQQQRERDRPRCLFTEQPREEAPSVTRVSLNISRCWACSWACNRVCALRAFARRLCVSLSPPPRGCNTCLTCLCISSKTKACDRSSWSSRSSWISTGGALWQTEACTFNYTHRGQEDICVTFVSPWNLSAVWQLSWAMRREDTKDHRMH